MIKKNLLFFLIIFTFLLTACTGSSNTTNEYKYNFVPSRPDAVRDYPLDTVSGKSAFDYLKDEKILTGWNLGNTLDSYSDGFAGESLWGNPFVNQTLMNGIKSAGFNIIRIPVTWMGYIGNAPEHRIAASRLERVADIVDMAHKAGLKVIINLHHDGSTSSEGKEEGWLSLTKSYKNKSEYNRITHQFARTWDQIAAYFKNYGDWLMFESMNEIHDGGWGWSTDFKMFPFLQHDIINKWNQIFTDRVRAAGGNNAERYLVLPAYCTIPEQTLADSFILPNDTIAGKQIVTFHYYDPYQFGIQGSRSAWGTPEEKQKVDKDFAPFKERFIDKKIPVIIGEAGAVLQLYPNDAAMQAQARQSRIDYISHVFSTAKKYGLIPVYWDNGSISGNGEKFGLINRATGQPNSSDSRALITVMTNVVN